MKKLPNAYRYRMERRNNPTPHEKIMMAILRSNRSYFEFQPVVFCRPLSIHISPDFLVFSWKNRTLPSPVYIEVDGNAKRLDEPYQMKRIEGLKYPVIRIWNRDVQNAGELLSELLNDR